MTNYTKEVHNPTDHLQQAFEHCKVGNYSWRMYDEIIDKPKELSEEDKAVKEYFEKKKRESKMA